MSLLQKNEKGYHRLTRGEYLREMVYGANDGIVTTFAVVSGAVGAAFSTDVIIILGLAGLLGDGFSMAASNFLSIISQQKFHLLQRRKEEEEVEKMPEVEKDEVREILRGWNIPDNCIESSLDAITKDKKKWVDLMMREELDIIEENSERPYKKSIATFVAFVVAGFFPLLPYFFSVPQDLRFIVSIIGTAVALFAVGAARAWLLKKEWWFSLGLEMLAIGSIAAFIAYGVGFTAKYFVGLF